MKKDIILSGVGGQGILSIAAIIGKAALNEGLRIKQAEVHGMSQRGGDVQSNLRISSEAMAMTSLFEVKRVGIQAWRAMKQSAASVFHASTRWYEARAASVSSPMLPRP